MGRTVPCCTCRTPPVPRGAASVKPEAMVTIASSSKILGWVEYLASLIVRERVMMPLLISSREIRLLWSRSFSIFSEDMLLSLIHIFYRNDLCQLEKSRLHNHVDSAA